MPAERGSHKSWQGELMKIFLSGKPNKQVERAYRRLSRSMLATIDPCGGVASRT